MKKLLLIGCLILITACQPATATPAPSFFPTSTTPASATPIPVTFTPQPTSTPAPSPTPFPRFFTNEFDSSLEGWVMLQAGTESVPDIQNENGNVILQMGFPYVWLYALYGAQDYSNIRIETQFTNRALTPASAGLICRYSEEDGWFEYNVSTDGTYNVLYGRWLSMGIPEYLPITNGSSKQIQPSGTTQRVGLACSDTTLFLYINEALLRQVDVSRYELAQGKVGLTAASYENTPIVVGFDWVTVSEP
ncbi:MAG TPA: hypothetical protein VFR47_23505 [Anaerolineales bacterium]|nr:hypothetical protein [Anaerolineales bacterium]